MKLVVDDLSFAYHDYNQPVLNHVDFTLHPKTITLLIGQSGCGKSTFLKVISGLFPQYKGTLITGTVSLDEYDILNMKPNDRCKYLALLFQNPSYYFSFQTAREQMIFALENQSLTDSQIDNRISYVCEQLNCADLIDRKVSTLSGGQRQLLAIAIVLCLDSEYILLDEPFANIDIQSRTEVQRVLQRLNKQYHKTIVIADHDYTGYYNMIDEIYRMDNGQVKRIDDLSFLKDTPNNTPIHNSISEYDTTILKWNKLSYLANQQLLVKNSNFQLPVGKIGLLSGDNGAGKSTLFNILTKQYEYQGNITFKEKEQRTFKAKEWCQEVTMAFQDSRYQFIELTVREELKSAINNSHHPEFWTQKRIETTIDKLNIRHILDHSVYEISGGQAKKVQVLLMLIVASDVVLLDEVLSGLDDFSQIQVLDLIKQTCISNRLACLLISHQRKNLPNYCDYEINLSNKQLTLLEDSENEA